MEIIDRFPQFRFQPSKVFMWQPEVQTISFDPKRLSTAKGKMQLLHEIGHALLAHSVLQDDTRYQSERAAWEVARSLAEDLGYKSQELLIARQLKQLRDLGF